MLWWWGVTQNGNTPNPVLGVELSGYVARNGVRMRSGWGSGRASLALAGRYKGWAALSCSGFSKGILVSCPNLVLIYTLGAAAVGMLVTSCRAISHMTAKVILPKEKKKN